MEGSNNKNSKDLQISQWHGIINAKCPRCRVGNIFNGPTYSLKAQKMNDNCSHCGLRYEREPGYFYVAMFVSYAMTVAEMISVCVGAHILGLSLDYDSLWYYVGLILGAVLLLSPFNYRYSRIILLYWLSPGLNYEPSRSAKK